MLGRIFVFTRISAFARAAAGWRTDTAAILMRPKFLTANDAKYANSPLLVQSYDPALFRVHG
jgi:hypothetical protein